MKRLLLRIGVFVLLGAVINIAVAWIIAYNGQSNPPMLPQYTTWFRDRQRHYGHIFAYRAFIRVMYRNEVQIGSSDSYPDQQKTNPRYKVDLKMPHWTHARRSQMGLDDPNLNNIMQDAAGWPCHCARCTFILPQGPAMWPATIHEGIALKPYVYSTGWTIPRAFPLRPIWPGFAVNTLFYATILWLISLGPFALRRAIRRRRGRCIKCGYDLRGSRRDDAAASICPECGWPS